jgi:inhibitor of cysteine peptidase
MLPPYRLIISTAVLAALLAACGLDVSPPEETPVPQQIKIETSLQPGEPTQPAGVMDLRVGDTLELAFESNPTTGYQWEVTELNPDVLRPLGEEFVAPASDLLGAPGKQFFRFEAVAPGETPLKLIYHRSFEPEVPPEQTYQVRIFVK